MSEQLDVGGFEAFEREQVDTQLNRAARWSTALGAMAEGVREVMSKGGDQDYPALQLAVGPQAWDDARAQSDFLVSTTLDKPIDEVSARALTALPPEGAYYAGETRTFRLTGELNLDENRWYPADSATNGRICFWVRPVNYKDEEAQA
jgi:hypothetical protein